MHTYLFAALGLNAAAVLIGLVAIARRVPLDPPSYTMIAVKTFGRLVFCGWAIYLLARGA